MCFGGLWLGVALCMVCACAIAFVGLALCVENSLCGLFCDLCGPLRCVYLFCVCGLFCTVPAKWPAWLAL